MGGRTRRRLWSGGFTEETDRLVKLGFPAQAQTATKRDPPAEVDGVPITAGEVEKALTPAVAKLQERLYDLKREQLEVLMGERLLIREAAKRGLTVPALLDAEVTAKVGVVTEQGKFWTYNDLLYKNAPKASAEQLRNFAREAGLDLQTFQPSPQ